MHPSDAINFFPVMSSSGFWNAKDTEGLYQEVAKSATGSENRKQINNSCFGHENRKGTKERNDKIYSARIPVIYLKVFPGPNHIFKYIQIFSKSQSPPVSKQNTN